MISSLDVAIDKGKPQEAVEAVDESDQDVGCVVIIPGSIKATAPISAKELLSSVCGYHIVLAVYVTSFQESPFREDALKRTRYENASEVRPSMSRVSFIECIQCVSSEAQGIGGACEGCTGRELSQTCLGHSAKVCPL